MNTKDTIAFIKCRVRKLVVQARLQPETCHMARGYMNRVFLWAMGRHDAGLMAFVTEQEELIIGGVQS